MLLLYNNNPQYLAIKSSLLPALMQPFQLTPQADAHSPQESVKNDINKENHFFLNSLFLVVSKIIRSSKIKHMLRY